MFHNFEMGEGIFMKLWHNVILNNSKRSWELSGCGYINKGCHALLKIAILGLKSWIVSFFLQGTVGTQKGSFFRCYSALQKKPANSWF